MVDFSLALPEEICQELGARARARRVLLNISTDELAARVGVSRTTLQHFETEGRCRLDTFVRILEALNVTSDLSNVLVTQSRSIDDMRSKAAVATRKRAYTKRKPAQGGTSR